jgi:hypothetical protein
MVLDLRLTSAHLHVLEVELETPKREVGLVCHIVDFSDEKVFYIGIIISVLTGQYFPTKNASLQCKISSDATHPSHCLGYCLWSALVRAGPPKGFSLLLVPSHLDVLPRLVTTSPAVTLATRPSNTGLSRFLMASIILRLTVTLAILHSVAEKTAIERVYLECCSVTVNDGTHQPPVHFLS